MSERDLPESEQKFRAVFENAHEAMLVADDDSRIVDANAAACELLGLSKAKMLDLRTADLVPPGVREAAVASWQALRTAGKQKGEWRLLRSDGRTRLVEYNATADVLPGRHLCAMRDIEGSRWAERSLRFLAEASRALASSLDYQATLPAVARLAVPMIADSATVDLVGEDGTIRRLATVHADPTKAESEVVSSMRAPLRVHGQGVGAITLTASVSGRRFEQNDLALAEELGRRASTAMENARLYQEAQEANRIKDGFIAAMSHELRTPLNAILGWAALLRNDDADAPTYRRGLESIERNARAQARLVEDVLDASRIIVGKFRVEFKAVDVASAVRAAADVVAPTAAAKGVDLEIEIEHQPCFIFGDLDRLQQIVWNLVSNAVKFTPRSGRVCVHLERVGSKVVVRVNDTGSGIDPEFLPHVFQRFQQADSSTTRRHGGLGLGLAIARHLVELHGGAITAESPGPGAGATFTVELPVGAVEPVRDARPPAEPKSAGVKDLHGLRVLVCDDEMDARDLIDEVLARHGARVMSVGSAEDALLALERFRPEVLVSDIGMPDVDGYGLIREIRTRPADHLGGLPALALTAYVQGEDVRRALAAGFQQHLAKPVDPSDLVAAVGRLGGLAAT